MKKIATVDNITKARKELIDEHVDVTTEKIRKRIGGGSYNTISKTLREINEQETAAAINQQDPNEDQVLITQAMPLLKSIFQICKKRADLIALAGYKGLELAVKDVDDKAARIDELEELYEARAQVNETELTKVKAEADAKIAKLEAENETLKAQIQFLTQSLQDAKDAILFQKQIEDGYKEIIKQLSELTKSKDKSK